MAKKGTNAKGASGKVSAPPTDAPAARGRPSALLDTRVVYCGDCLEQLRSLPDACVDLVYIDPARVSEVEPPFNSNRNYEVFWGETKEKRAFFGRGEGESPDCHRPHMLVLKKRLA